eukprot:6197395-Pleurochrysis_carterae.AAC.1
MHASACRCQLMRACEFEWGGGVNAQLRARACACEGAYGPVCACTNFGRCGYACKCKQKRQSATVYACACARFGAWSVCA